MCEKLMRSSMIFNKDMDQRNVFEKLDVDDLDILDATLSKIKRHVDRHLEGALESHQISKYLGMKWFIHHNF